MTPVSRFRLVPMRPRDPHEEGRSASTLELFFDLVFVVAVTLIVLGESLLGSANAIIEALHDTKELGSLIGVAAWQRQRAAGH
jgi:low temperature requirement protein LtrA